MACLSGLENLRLKNVGNNRGGIVVGLQSVNDVIDFGIFPLRCTWKFNCMVQKGLSSADFVAFVVVGRKVQISIPMSCFAIDINTDRVILARNQSIQEGDLLVRFLLNSKWDMWIDGIKCSMKRVNSISFDDTKAVIYVAFTYFRLYFRRVDGHFFDRLHAQVRHHRTDSFSVFNSAKFAEEISNVDIQDNEVMLSFDVVSLFTAIPVDKACDYISYLKTTLFLHARAQIVMKSFHC